MTGGLAERFRRPDLDFVNMLRLARLIIPITLFLLFAFFKLAVPIATSFLGPNHPLMPMIAFVSRVGARMGTILILPSYLILFVLHRSALGKYESSKSK